MEARVELRPLLLDSPERMKDLIFLDIALDSTFRTAIERSYEELNDAAPEVGHTNIAVEYIIKCDFPYRMLALAYPNALTHDAQCFNPENNVLHQSCP